MGGECRWLAGGTSTFDLTRELKVRGPRVLRPRLPTRAASRHSGAERGQATNQGLFWEKCILVLYYLEVFGSYYSCYESRTVDGPPYLKVCNATSRWALYIG